MMYSLEEVRRKNFIISMLGANFIAPLFRELSEQYPFDVKKFTVYGDSETQRNKKFGKILKNNKDSFVVIFRDQNAELEDVLFVPSTEMISRFRNDQCFLAT